MQHFKPTFLALIRVNGQTYEYYGNAEHELSLIEEQPSYKLYKSQILNYTLAHTVETVPLYATSIKFPRIQFNKPIVFTTGAYQVSIEQFYKKGGEAIIYKGFINDQAVIFKMHTRRGKQLRALPSALRPYLPQKYLLFEEGRGRYVVAMQPLQKVEWSPQILDQSLAFLAQLETLNEVHGDISTGNMMMDDAGNVKFIDFARSNSVKGTPFYSKGNSDRQALARVLLSYKYTHQIKEYLNQLHLTNIFPSLSKLYRVYLKYYTESNITEYWEWFKWAFPQDAQSLYLLEMAI